MRYDAEHKERTRQKVLSAAAKAIRAEGPHQLGVAGVMADAGLTHGGFYAHFKSKNALIAATVDYMFEQSREKLLRTIQGLGAREGLAAYIDWYLSPEHRDARRAGCPVAAVGSDLPRLVAPVRERFAAGTRRMAESLGQLLAQIGHADSAALAASVQSELIGALSLARIESDPARSDAILDGSRRALKRRLNLEVPS